MPGLVWCASSLPVRSRCAGGASHVGARCRVSHDSTAWVTACA